MSGQHMIKEYLSVTISNITIDEAEEMMRLVREFELREPSRVIFGMVKGLEDKPAKEAEEILKKIFPRMGMGG